MLAVRFGYAAGGPAQGIGVPLAPLLATLQHTLESFVEIGLGYLSLEGMEGAVAEKGPFCNACFSGDYHAPLVDVGLAANHNDLVLFDAQ